MLLIQQPKICKCILSEHHNEYFMNGRMTMYYVYILASGKNKTTYIGITNNLLARTLEHKRKATDGFAERYDAVQLVWYEECEDVRFVIQREKRLKKWNRKWKIHLIEKT